MKLHFRGRRFRHPRGESERLETAAEMDRQYRATSIRRRFVALHPDRLKDIHTFDVPTTGGNAV